ncbi:DMT family transporter [Streptomyces sp. NPDC006285]|uniref:DMT family transporter n=1 Tax=Streptomyces sp. NPDC006285 TaxID=3364742 RepID=UPI00368723AB
MSATLLAVVLSLVSAVAYAAAAVAQERLASRTKDAGTLRLLGRGAWWWSVGLNAGAALLHVAALKYGTLTLVQPLGALTLVAAVPLGARLAGRRVTAVEWRGTALTLAGLCAVLVTASGPAPDDVLSVPQALAVTGATAALIGVLARPGTRPGLRHATASGFASGVASALTQTVTVAATDRSGPLFSGQVIAVAVLVAAFAAGGLLLSQVAYKGGLGAPLAVVTLANPVAAAVIGLALLGERLQGGAAGLLLAGAGAAVAAWGVVTLSRATPSPVPLPSPVLPPVPVPSAVPASLAVPASSAVGPEQHPVAAVLALGSEPAAYEPSLLPRQPKPGHRTSARGGRRIGRGPASPASTPCRR